MYNGLPIEILDPRAVVILLMDETRASLASLLRGMERQVGYYGNTIFLGVNNSRGELYNRGITAWMQAEIFGEVWVGTILRGAASRGSA